MLEYESSDYTEKLEDLADLGSHCHMEILVKLLNLLLFK